MRETGPNCQMTIKSKQIIYRIFDEILKSQHNIVQTGTNINFFETLNKNSEKAKDNYPYIIEYYRKKLEMKENEIVQMKAKISSMQSFNNRKRNSSIIRDNYMNYGSYLKDEIHKRSKSQSSVLIRCK